MKKLLLLSLLPFSASAGDITFQFKSPSFNGQGTSSHYLTIENQETSRKEAIAKKLEDELRAAIAAENNSTVNRFLKNVESRIYAELSRQLGSPSHSLTWSLRISLNKPNNLLLTAHLSPNSNDF